MTRDWAAVARVIDEHMTQLGLNHRELADRSGVALSIVRELRHNTVQRHRKGRTLEALSLALNLHPQHLSHVLTGNPPPDATTSPTGDHRSLNVLVSFAVHSDVVITAHVYPGDRVALMLGHETVEIDFHDVNDLRRFRDAIDELIPMLTEQISHLDTSLPPDHPTPTILTLP